MEPCRLFSLSGGGRGVRLLGKAVSARPRKGKPSRRRARSKVTTGTGIRVRARDRAAGGWFAKLMALQGRLRAPKGCPWDREQTHQSLRKFLVEETYEVLDAMDSGDPRKFA